MDQWELREANKEKADRLGYFSNELFYIEPAAFQDGKDGPTHSSHFRKRFWTDVLKSLELSVALIEEKGRSFHNPLPDGVLAF